MMANTGVHGNPNSWFQLSEYSKIYDPLFQGVNNATSDNFQELFWFTTRNV